MKCTVEGTVAAAAETVAHDAAAAGGNRAGAGQGGKGCFVAAAPNMRPGDQGLGGADRADAAPGQQFRGMGLDDLGELLVVSGQLTGGRDDGGRKSP